MATISVDLRERILKAYDKGGATREMVAARYEVSLGMVKKLIQQRTKTGDIAPRHHYSGRKPMITAAHRQKLQALIEERSDITLAEMREATGLKCSLTAIHYALDEMGLTYKKRHSRQQSISVQTSKPSGVNGQRP